MKKLFFFATTFLVVLSASCSKDSDVFDDSSVISDDTRISELSNKGATYDIVDILNSPIPPADEPNQIDAKTSLEKENTPVIGNSKLDQKDESTISDAFSRTLDVNRDLEAEAALKKLEENVNEHQKSINNLRKINLTKDQTIASLSTINDELLNEIKRIKSMNKTGKDTISDNNTNYSQIDLLKREVMKLKNTLILKSKELDNLRFQNNSLEGRISELEVLPRPNILERPQKTFSYGITSGTVNNSTDGIRKSSSSEISSITYPSDSGTCSLEFDAVVTSLSGRNKEAFFTEFFVLPLSLENALEDVKSLSLEKFQGISSFGELWARSRENPFLYPNTQKTIRAALLANVEKGVGKRVRTDVDGFAKLNNLRTGKHYIIGTATLGKVGVTWNVPVSLRSGSNKVSLTLENSAWSL